ncbi:HNH endonuclease signature motif containing protein [Methylobacterium hispanicum]|uniref:HNH endonuclease n=1 Tax=Methylobacterium hispanicum TaxID=270350 RepID=UPI002F3125DB
MIENIADDCDGLRICWCCGKQGYQERAHIIPHSLGGPDTAENLFLLCSACHLQAPDMRQARWFFDWINTEANRQLELNDDFWKVARAALEAGFPVAISAAQAERFCALYPVMIKELMIDATSHGCEVVASTLRAVSIGALDETLKIVGKRLR